MTRPPRGTPPAVKPQVQEHIVTQKRHYLLMTPLFGGGAIAGKRDAVTIIRGTEIRGCLRFWWRALYGGRYSAADEMKKAEDTLWGKATTAKEENPQRNDETVQMTVEVQKTGRAIAPFLVESDEDQKKHDTRGNNKRKTKYWKSSYNKTSDVPQYVAFMFRLSDEEKEQKARPANKLVYADIEFTVTLSYPRIHQQDIAGALWAWETFGGIGARTRRGFGALRLESILEGENIPVEFERPAADNVAGWIKEQIERFHTASSIPMKGLAPKGTPCLATDMEVRALPSCDTAMQAWEKVIAKLAGFRQYPNGRRTPFGPSLWPEADAIKEKNHTSRYLSPKFPRAAFGLPIVFHFLKRPDLKNLTLQGAQEGFDRLASPLLLRPLYCQDGKTVGLAAVLKNRMFPPGGIVLVDPNTPHTEPLPVDPSLNDADVSKIQPLHGESDVLRAFMKYFGEEH